MYLPINYQFRFCKSAAKINFYFETCKKIGEKFRKSCWQGENVYKCAKNKKDEMVSDYNFSYYSFFLRGYKGLKVVTICYYKYLYINIYNYIFIYTFLYLHFKSVILGQNKTVITEIVICNRFFSGIEKHTLIAPKTMPISSQSYEL